MTRYYKMKSGGVVYPDTHVEPGDRKHTTPVLVIDPEDREAVERLHDALLGDYANLFTVAETADAIRSLLDHKPAEPNGLGAVVRDREDVSWVRVAGGWRSPLRWANWCDLDIPDKDYILSPGVEVES